MVEILGSLSFHLLHSGSGLFLSLLMSLVVQHSQHLVVVIVDIKLQWVLVVSEKCIVSISQISKSASLNQRLKENDETYQVE